MTFSYCIRNYIYEIQKTLEQRTIQHLEKSIAKGVCIRSGPTLVSVSLLLHEIVRQTRPYMKSNMLYTLKPDSKVKYTNIPFKRRIKSNMLNSLDRQGRIKSLPEYQHWKFKRNCTMTGRIILKIPCWHMKPNMPLRLRKLLVLPKSVNVYLIVNADCQI